MLAVALATRSKYSSLNRSIVSAFFSSSSVTVESTQRSPRRKNVLRPTVITLSATTCSSFRRRSRRRRGRAVASERSSDSPRRSGRRSRLPPPAPPTAASRRRRRRPAPRRTAWRSWLSRCRNAGFAVGVVELRQSLAGAARSSRQVADAGRVVGQERRVRREDAVLRSRARPAP